MKFEDKIAKAVQAGSDAYDAVTDQHSGWTPSGDTTCKCGRTFSRTSGLGLHIKAVRKLADQAHTAAFMKEI